jgi:hypothetical protein
MTIGQARMMPFCALANDMTGNVALRMVAPHAGDVSVKQSHDPGTTLLQDLNVKDCHVKCSYPIVINGTASTDCM